MNVPGLRTLLALLLASALVAPWLACGSEGPAERAGQKIDEAVDKVRGEPDLGEKIDRTLSGGGPAENAGRNVDDAVEDAKKKAQEAKREMQDAFDGS